MNEMKEVLPLYIGQKVKSTEGTMLYTLFGISGDDPLFRDVNGYDCLIGKGWKLILRPLSSITEEEGRNLGWDDRMGWETRWDGKGMPHVITPKEFVYLLSKGFDLFGLKEKGLAIYESDLK